MKRNAIVTPEIAAEIHLAAHIQEIYARADGSFSRDIAIDAVAKFFAYHYPVGYFPCSRHPASEMRA